MVYCPLALLGNAFYPILVHRLAASLHASSPQSVTLVQLRFTSFAVINLRWDLHPQECAHAGRTTKKPGSLWIPAFNLPGKRMLPSAKPLVGFDLYPAVLGTAGFGTIIGYRA